MTESALYHIERGRSWPEADAIVRLAGVLCLAPEELVAAMMRGWLLEHRPHTKGQP
jgi:hypothetical protein